MRQLPEQLVEDHNLAAVLERCLRMRFGRTMTITRLERRISPYSSSFAIEDLDVYTQSGERLQLIFKNLSPNAMLADARRAKPPFLIDPQREVDVYRQMLDRIDVGAPRLYGAVVDQDADRYWLFLERVDGRPLGQVGDWATWIAAARWLARMHVRLSADRWRWPERAVHYDAHFYRMWIERAILASDKEDLRDLAGLTPAYESVAQRLLSMEPSLIHGEFYPSNVLISEGPDEVRICPIDWEMAGLAPPLIDLAALTAGQWTEEERKALVLAYRDAACESGELMASEAQIMEDVACCRLHLAFQWLGWSTSWTAPPGRAWNWLSEAQRAVGYLGLR